MVPPLAMGRLSGEAMMSWGARSGAGGKWRLRSWKRPQWRSPRKRKGAGRVSLIAAAGGGDDDDDDDDDDDYDSDWCLMPDGWWLMTDVVELPATSVSRDLHHLQGKDAFYSEKWCCIYTLYIYIYLYIYISLCFRRSKPQSSSELTESYSLN